jgi:murein DD-endopeptidase MepM/ murein hydrolase activator NlpD
MARSKWTVMLIPHDNERVRSLQLSGSSVRTILAGLVVAALVFGGVASAILLSQGEHLRAQQLERENLLLAAEVTGMRSEMESLAASIEELTAKDEKYRTIAGLPAIDPGRPARRHWRAGHEDAGVATGLQENPALGEQIFAASYDLETLVRRATLLQASMDEALTTLQENTERLAATPTISPSSGHLSSLFSNARRHPVLRITRPHQGIDIAAPVGEPIHAPAKGRVVYAGNRAGGYGLTVEIDHGYGYLTRFAHASRILVRVGETVERGQTIAEVGATGIVTGPHLHYEIEVNGVAVDPLDFIIADALPD